MVNFLSFGVLLELASAFSSSKKDKELFKEAGDTLISATNVFSKYNVGSVAESAARSLISPMVVFEDSLTHQDYMQDLITIINLRDIRDALTHLSLEGTSGGIKISKLVNQINPNRSAGFMSLQGCEAIDLADTITNRQKKEQTVDDEQENNDKNNKSSTRKEERVSVDPNDITSTGEYAPLALGRVVKASSLIDGKEVTFFLTFRQIPIAATAKDLKLVFQSTVKGVGFGVRLKEYRAGGITRPELLTGTDIIKKEFNIRNNDLSGYYNEAKKRESNNRKASLRTGIVSLNTMANTIIMTKETATDIEYDIGLRFSSSNIKAIRRHVNANTIVIVNDARGIFEFYTVGDPFPVKYTLSQIRMKSKKEDTGSLESLIKLLSGN